MITIILAVKMTKNTFSFTEMTWGIVKGENKGNETIGTMQ
jgi:hypothetical protein